MTVLALIIAYLLGSIPVGYLMVKWKEGADVREIGLMHWGVEMARKGGVPKGRVLTCLSLAKLEHYLAARPQPPRPSQRIRSRADRLQS